MKLRSAGGSSICLLVTFALFFGASAQNCQVANNGIIIEEDFNLQFDDTTPSDTIVYELDILENSVQSVSVAELNYLKAEIVDTKIQIKTTDQFPSYEQNEAGGSFTNTLVMRCADSSDTDLTMFSYLSLTNNYDPAFENQNNGEGYLFELPMPFPKGININSAFGVDIRAFDVDVDNTDILFEIDDPEGNFEIVELGESSDPKKRYSIGIRTLRLLDLTEPTSITITATDVYPGGPARTKQVVVDIIVDEENTTPRSPSFSSMFYQALLETPEETGEIQPHEPITIMEPPAGVITLVLGPAPGNLPSLENKFSATYMSEGVVKLELIEPLEETDLENPALALELHASEPQSGFSARTVVHISLPVVVCEPTTTTPDLSTCPSVGTCEPCTTESTCPTCPTEGTCPTCPTEGTCPPPLTCPTAPPCPTCAPCTTTTPAPPSSIEFEEEQYMTTVSGQYKGTLFTVLANITDGSDGTIVYGVEADSEEMKTRLVMDPVTGVLSLNRKAPPGTYIFDLTATYVEENAVARVPGFLDVSSVGECVDGTTCFAYALFTVDAPEATANDNLIPGSEPSDPSCEFRIDYQVPDKGWFNIDQNTGALKITAEADIEDAVFADVETPQIRLRLQVQCDSQPWARENKSVQPLLEETVTKQQMIVIVTLTNRNEHAPVFVQQDIIVGYPNREFAQQLFPGAVAKVEANDADKNDKERIRYRFERAEEQLSIDEINGEIYPVDGAFQYIPRQVPILALDNEGQNGALQGTTLLTLQIVKEGQVAVALFTTARIDDTELILAELNEKITTYTWGSLRSSYFAGNWEEEQRALEGGLLLVLYAIGKDDLIPASHGEIKSMLSEETWSWTVSNVETWEVAGGWDNGVGGGDPDEGLTIAVIVLSIIVALCLFAIAAIVYFTVYRKKRMDKIGAHVGVKNRTSFSKHRESIAVEASKRSYVNGLEPPKIEGEMEERKKSSVKFNDEPEVIPNGEEVVRL